LFSTDQEHLGYVNLDVAIRATHKWAASSSELNTPVTPDDEITNQIGKVYQKGHGLIDFYNTKRPLLMVYSIPQSEPNAWSVPQVHIDRLLAVVGFVGLLGGDAKAATIMKQAGMEDWFH